MELFFRIYRLSERLLVTFLSCENDLIWPSKVAGCVSLVTADLLQVLMDFWQRKTPAMQRKTQELITAPNSDPLKLWEEKLEDHLLKFLGCSLPGVPNVGFKIPYFSVRKESLEPQKKRELHPRDQRGKSGRPPKHTLVGGIPTPLKNISQVSWDDGILNLYIYIYIWLYMEK